MYHVTMMTLPAMSLPLIPSLAPGNDSWVDRCVAVIDGDTIVVARGANVEIIF